MPNGTDVVNAMNKVANAVDKNTSMADQMVAASDRASTVTEKAVEASGAMGLKGFMWNNLGNVAAMTIISGSFLFLGREFILQSREKDVMFREAIQSLSASADKRSDKAEIVHGKTFEKLGMSIEKLVTVTEANQREVKEAAKDLKAAAQALVKIGDKQPP